MSQILLPGMATPVELSSPMYSNSHFTWAEFTRNGERLPETTDFGGIILSPQQIVANGVKLARALDLVRTQFGDNPVRIVSWLRPTAINKAVGGVPNSQHRIGWAADITIDGYQPRQVAAKLRPTWAGGLGDSIAFTHLDLRQMLGLAAARWNYGFA